jgi:hypothetical protein
MREKHDGASRSRSWSSDPHPSAVSDCPCPSRCVLPSGNFDEEYDYLFKVVLIGDSGVGEWASSEWPAGTAARSGSGLFAAALLTRHLSACAVLCGALSSLPSDRQVQLVVTLHTQRIQPRGAYRKEADEA